MRERVLSGTANANIDFLIFTKNGMPQIINIQSRGGKAKPYQVRQVKELIEAYHL